MYLLAALNTLLSLAIVMVSVCFLTSRLRRVAVTTAWLGALGLLVCLIGWLSGVKLFMFPAQLVDTFGITAVFTAGVLRLRAMRRDQEDLRQADKD
jgi:hypothetical protein